MKKKVLVLSENDQWYRFCERTFSKLASDIAEFHFWKGGFDVNNDFWLESIGYKADLIWSAHSYQVFPQRLVERVTCINSHPGFNPYNRGWYPYVFSIINDLPAGATLHVMDAKIDSGPIIDRTHIPIEPNDTAFTLWKKCHKAEKDLVTQWLRAVILGEYETTEPEHAGNYNSRKDYEALCRIKPDAVFAALDLIKRLRALTWSRDGNAKLQLPDCELEVGVMVDYILTEDTDDHQTIPGEPDARGGGE